MAPRSRKEHPIANDRREIDRATGEPAYLQLLNIIKMQMAEGIYPPGSRLPGESLLRRRYGVSPMTVRRTIKMLIDQGMVNTIRGSGTYVRPVALGSGTFQLSEFEQILKNSNKGDVKILEVQLARADEITARKLSLSPGERTILIRRLICSEKNPVLYHIENLLADPSRPIVETELEITSLHGLFLGGAGTLFKRGEMTISAIVLNSEESTLLNAPEMLPGFRIEHLFYDFSEKPVSWGRFICRGDRFRFIAQVGLPRSEVRSNG
jgi:GntR family transcriptional regulator